MKKYLCLLLVATTFGLMSCGDDNESKLEIPKLNRLTKITCTENGKALYQTDVTYDQAGQISRVMMDVQTDKGLIKYTDSYIYVGNTISVSGVKTQGSEVSNSFVHTVFTLSGDLVSEKAEKAENPAMNNEVYTATLNTYAYSRYQLGSASQKVQFPKTMGSGYEVRNLGEVNNFTWENENLVRFLYLPQQEFAYEYATDLCPENFPLRLSNSFVPVGIEALAPINLLYGKLSRNLVQRAYWYNLNDATNICAEYTFAYTKVGEYVTGMTVKEKINPVNGAVAAENTYEYTFIYNSLQ